MGVINNIGQFIIKINDWCMKLEEQCCDFEAKLNPNNKPMTKNLNNSYIDSNGYIRGIPSHSNLIHRQIAYKYLYLPNKEEYSLPFSKYIIHHIDGNKKNNAISNLKILTPEEHKSYHFTHRKRKSKIFFKLGLR